MMKLTKTIACTLLTVFALAGCSTSQSNAGSAAVVNGNVISQQTVTKQVKESIAQIAQSETQGQAPDAVLLGQQIINRLVLTELINKASTDLKINVTDAQVFEFQDSIYSQYGQDQVETQLVLTQGVPLSQLETFFGLLLREDAIAKKLKPAGTEKERNAAFSDYLYQLADESSISVSPRFGAWDAQQLKVAGSDNLLSSLANSE